MSAAILIVEDEGLIALDLKQKLEKLGYSISATVDNADDAISGVDRLRPALVLMDIRINGSRDGIAAADQIRRQFHVPVMFVTANADRETIERAKIAEPFGYIVKPFQNSDLRAQIEMALWKHQMEQRLRISESWLSTTFRNVADALIATDNEGNIAFMNQPASEMTGWDAVESKGRPLLDVFRIFEETTDLPAIHPLTDIRNGREPDAGTRTFKLRRPDRADAVLVDAEFSANRDEGTLIGIIVVFRDVTNRRKSERLERQFRKMDALALMATGLGTELADSQSRVEIAIKRLTDQSEGSALRLLADICNQTSLQREVVRELVELGREVAGQSDTLDLNGVLTEMEGEFRKILGIHCSLALHLQPGLPPVRAEGTELRENLHRLVVDARHAMPDGGAVQISTSTLTSGDNQNCIRLAIRDTRKLLPADARERVFDPYFRSRPGGRNPGFSLALVYRFVALTGGRIEVESVPRKGTAYLLTFPAPDKAHWASPLATVTVAGQDPAAQRLTASV